MSRIKKYFGLICVVLLFGCNVQKREISRLDTYAVKYPAEMAKLSNWLYPCFTGKLHSDTITTLKHDTLITPGQTIINKVNDTIYKTQIQTRIVTNTVQHNIIDTVMDERALSDLKLQLKAKSYSLTIVKTQWAQMKHTRNIWIWVAICACALILIWIVVKAYALLSGGWVSKLFKRN